MPQPAPDPDCANGTIGHLSVHIAGDHPDAVPFLFERSRKRAPGAAVASTMAHLLVFAFIVVGIRHAAAVEAAEARLHATPVKEVTWVALPGPGGGGGGGGSRSKEMPKKVDISQVRLETPHPVLEVPKPVDQPPQLTLAAHDLGESDQPITGTFDGALNGTGGGPGVGGGGGNGIGGGIGNGNGNGVGDGWGGGSGGGAYEPGNGVSMPRPVRQVKPVYTAEGMRAKIQGVAVVECVVLPDGTVGNARILKSLDQASGLDAEALKAARQWRFIPGLLRGQPVSVYVTIELAFTLR